MNWCVESRVYRGSGLVVAHITILRWAYDNMTAIEWETAIDPRRMLWVGKSQSSARKLRLVAVAFCRRILHLLAPIGDEDRLAVEIAEQCADELMPLGMLKQWHDKADLTAYSIGNFPAAWTPTHYALGAMGEVVNPDPYEAANNTQWLTQLALHPDYTPLGGELIGTHEHPIQCNIIRDICGEIFRSIILDPAWLTATVATIAIQMYESRDFEPIPILADALEEAGCDNADILTHSRGPGPHFRGCWVVDLILGKS